MGNVDDEQKKKQELISEIISSQDLLNIGLSKNYVTSIVARIKEYNDNTKKNKNNG